MNLEHMYKGYQNHVDLQNLSENGRNLNTKTCKLFNKKMVVKNGKTRNCRTSRTSRTSRTLKKLKYPNYNLVKRRNIKPKKSKQRHRK